jgi:hypothetical protein
MSQGLIEEISMRVVYRNHPIHNSNGSRAGVLDGEYEATPNAGQQQGWYALRKVRPNGTVEDEVAANVHIVGVTTT